MPARSISAARVLTPDGTLGPATVHVDGPTIAEVRPATGAVDDLTLVPGFVDLQVNGHDDVDVAQARGADWDRLDELLLAQGVTSWCPTLVTAEPDAYEPPLARIRERIERGGGGPEIVGAHLEGPFLGGHPGAHPADLFRPPDPAWVLAATPPVTLVTLAPETTGAAAAVRTLTEAGVTVALGHSGATFEQSVAAIDAGARLVTHAFNGMAALHHRAPGLIGAALADQRVAASVIADLVHVHPAALRLAARAKGPDGLVLVTDAVAWRAGRVGSVPLSLTEGAPRRPDGTLAGSALTMDQAVRNLVHAATVPFADAVRAASTNPARVLGLGDRGQITAGRRADLVALDHRGRVRRTWVAGEALYAA